MNSPRIGIVVSTPPSPGLATRIAAGEAPRRDYFLLAERLDAELLLEHASTRIGRVLRKRTGMDWDCAWSAYRQRDRFDVLVTDSEHVGIPLGALLRFCRRGPAHVMVAHRPAAGKKLLFLRATGACQGIDRIVCYGGLQASLLREWLDLDGRRVRRVLHPADHHFWRPTQRPKERLVLSAGLEFRDYQTLLAAVMGLDAKVVIAAASPWSKRRDETADRELPPNVTVGRLTPLELREAQERAAVVVVPLHPVTFQAGTLVMYEAMAMGNAVIATRTPSHALGEVIHDGRDGVLVTPEDPGALRVAIRDLLDHPQKRERLGRAARQRVEQGLNLDQYIEDMASVVGDAVRERTRPLRAPAVVVGGGS